MGGPPRGEIFGAAAQRYLVVRRVLPTQRQVRDEPINLTRSEFQVLRLLAGSPGQVFSRKEIMEELWQTEFRGDVRACDVHICNLRQKVERDPQNPELVLTVRRVGYRFAEDSS